MIRRKKMKTGVVVSNAMQKSVTVEVERKAMDPTYKKYVLRRKKFMAHDEKNVCQVGDRVEIMECRPLSKRKHWCVMRIVASERKNMTKVVGAK